METMDWMRGDERVAARLQKNLFDEWEVLLSYSFSRMKGDAICTKRVDDHISGKRSIQDLYSALTASGSKVVARRSLEAWLELDKQ